MKKDITYNRNKLQSLQRKIQLRYKLSIIYIKDRYNLEFELWQKTRKVRYSERKEFQERRVTRKVYYKKFVFLKEKP